MVSTSPALPAEISESLTLEFSSPISDSNIANIRIQTTAGILLPVWIGDEDEWQFLSQGEAEIRYFTCAALESSASSLVLSSVNPVEVESVQMYHYDNLEAYDGLVLPFIWDEDDNPATLSVGESMAVIVNGVYFVYTRLADVYRVDYIPCEADGAKGFAFRRVDDDWQLIGATCYIGEPGVLSDVLDYPAEWPVPMPDSVTQISAPIGAPVGHFEI